MPVRCRGLSRLLDEVLTSLNQLPASFLAVLPQFILQLAGGKHGNYSVRNHCDDALARSTSQSSANKACAPRAAVVIRLKTDGTGSAEVRVVPHSKVHGSNLRQQLIKSGHTSKTPGFAPRTVHVGFAVDGVALGQVFLGSP